MAESLNHESAIPEVKSIGRGYNWSAVMHLINSRTASEDAIIESIRMLLKHSFDPAEMFGLQPVQPIVEEPPQDALMAAPLLVALERGHYEVLKYLVGSDFINYFTPHGFLLATSVVVRTIRADLLRLMLSSPLGILAFTTDAV